MADPDSLHRLLDVQDRDLQADQLRHRRASLPDRLALAEQEAGLAKLDLELEELRTRLGELQRTQKRLEDEIASIEAKGESEGKRLYSGTVTAPRELQSIQEEIGALARRQRTLEDELLDVLEVAEPLGEQVDGLDARRDELAAEADRLRTSIAEAEAVIDAELAEVGARRAALVDGLPAALLAQYERIRSHLGGIGIARLANGQCTGCHLTLPATELDRVKRAAEGTVVTHEECGRILVL